MTKFNVKCFNGGIADGKGMRETEADDPKAAAEMACGCRVRGGRGKLGELCAEVLSAEDFPVSRTLFYKDQNSY